MKATTFALFAGAAVAMPAGPPDLGAILAGIGKSGGIGGLLPVNMMPTLKVAQRTSMTPELRANAKKTKTRYGPYTVIGQSVPNRPRGFSLDPKGQSFFNVIDNVCEGACTILAGSTGLEFEDGSVAGPEHGMYIHHILTSDISKKGITPVSPCDQAEVDSNKLPVIPPPPGAGFIGQGEDNGKSPLYFTTPDGKYDSGFHVGKGDKFSVMADLVNYAPETRQVYLVWELEYVDGIVGQDSTPNLMSVTGCAMKQPNISQTARAVTQSKKFPVLIDAVITSAKGHMHNGGEAMKIKLNDQELCVSKPTYVGENIQGMSTCALQTPIKRGDYMTIESVYNLPEHPVRKGTDGMAAHDVMNGDDIMGMFTLSFAYGDAKSA